MNPPNENRPERIAIEISWGTILRCLSLILLIAIMVQLGPLIGLLLVAILLAVTLEVVVKWLIGMGVKRRIAVLILLLVTAGVVAAVGLFLLPAIVGQAQTVGEKIPEIRQEILDKLPKGRITQEVERLWAHPDLIVNWKDSLVSVGSFLTKAVYIKVIRKILAYNEF